MTTREPGASEVLTELPTLRPRSTAFLASRPAASMTLGLEVLVQQVIAAMTTSPWRSSTRSGLGSVSGTRSGVGRLCIISISVSGLVLFGVVTRSTTSVDRRLRAAAGDRADAGAGDDLQATPPLALGTRVLLGAVQQLRELGAEALEGDAVLRALGAGDAGLDRREVELDAGAVVELAVGRHAEHVLGDVILAHGIDLGLAAAGVVQVGAGLLVDREEAHGGAVLGGHVAESGAVGDGQRRGALAEELDELADDLVLAQHLGDGEDEVGGGGAGRELALEVDADDIRGEEVDRLAEHAGLGLDATDAPADDAEAVDHRGVRVGADERVRIVNVVLIEHAAGEVLEVDLMDDADAGRHDVEALERGGAPLEELVALAVAAKLDLHVALEGVGLTVVVDLHGVVDDEVDGDQRLDDRRVTAEARGGRIASRRGRPAAARR